ncbi:MAG: hypothetical protein HXX20_20645, partial [Chloroflexi bacterium]|nr:hypothetical protein [Chloroflexota bacterium]
RSNLQLDDAYWSDVLSSSAYKHQGRITDLLEASEVLSLSLEEGITSQLPYSLGLDYPASLEGSKWQPLVNSMNQALSNWVSLRKAALHSSDSSAQVTIGFNDLYLVSLPANKQLDFLSPHLYGGGTAGLVSLMASLTWLRKAFPQMPLILGEFGASGVQWPDQPISEDTIASYETVVWLWLWQNGFSGGFKWMLNNAPFSPDWVEATYGLLDDNRQPKQSLISAQSVMSFIGSGSGAGEEFYNNPLYKGRMGNFTRLELGLNGQALSYSYAFVSNTSAYFFGNGGLTLGSNVTSPSPSLVSPNGWLLIQEGQVPWSLGFSLLPPQVQAQEQKKAVVRIQTASPVWGWLDLESLGQYFGLGHGSGDAALEQITVRPDPLSLEVSDFPVSNTEESTKFFSFVTRSGSIYSLNFVSFVS